MYQRHSQHPARHCCNDGSRSYRISSPPTHVLLVQVEPVLQAMEDVLGSLTQTLDGRVYVALGRGLWDFTAREIYEYADELAESKENQVSDISCL